MITNNTGTVLAKAVAKVLVVCHPVAGAAVPTISENLITDLATTDDVGLTASGWTATGGGTRTGTTISAGGSQYYYTRGDFDISGRQTWLIEAVLSAPAVGVPGERGARLWTKFFDPDALPIPPPPFRQLRTIEVRLMEDAGGNKRLALVDGADGSEKAALQFDWTTTGPRYRVRLKRQQIGGVNYVLLQTEPANTFEDPTNLNPDPDTSNSVKVALSVFSTTTGSVSEFGFGNLVPGTYSSDFESILVTRATDSTTVLPYWPATPPAPTLVHDDKGSAGQVVVSYVDLGSLPMTVPYLATDVATLSLVHSGGTSTVSITDPSATNDGLQYTTFSGLASGQTASGFVTVCEVSGRCSSSTTVGVVIP